jgi:uncharacterized protein
LQHPEDRLSAQLPKDTAMPAIATSRFPVRALGGAAALAALCCSLLVVPAAAQKSPAADPERVSAAKDMFKAMGQDAQFEAVINTMMRGMAQQLKQQRPAAATQIDEAATLMIGKFLARKGEMVDLTAALYAEKFTAAELREVTAFYISPIGKKMVSEQPGIMQRSMVAGMEWGRRIGVEADRELRQELKKRGVDL